MKRIVLCSWIAAGVSHLSALSMTPQDPTLPTTKQAIFFRQIFHYDEILKGGEIVLLLLEPEDEGESLAELAEAFNKTGVSVKTVSLEELTAPVDPATVLYVMPRSDLSLIEKFCSENKVLSISGVPTLAEKGHVSIGLGNSGGNPEIIINRGRLKAENHKLSSHLMRLAKLIE